MSVSMKVSTSSQDHEASGDSTPMGGLRARAYRTREAANQLVAACALAVKAAPAQVALSVLLAFAVGVLPVVSSWLTKGIVDHLVVGSSGKPLERLALFLAATLVFIAIVPQWIQYNNAEMQRRVAVYADERLYRAVNRLVGLARFEDPYFLDRLRLAQSEGGRTPSEIIETGANFGQASLTIVGFLGSLFLLSPLMTAIVLLAGVPTLIAEIILSKRRAKMMWAVGPAERKEFFYGSLLYNRIAAKEIRLFGIGDFLLGRLLVERRTANRAKRNMDRRVAVLQAGLGTLAACVSGGGLIWAVNAARNNSLSIGDVMMFVAAVAGVQVALRNSVSEIARAHHSMLMFKHYFDVTGAAPDLLSPDTARESSPLRSGLELRNVWFRYSAEHPWILQGVDLYIPQGKTTALVGLNGSGKSTLVKLLCRFYDPVRGVILWDGVDIREIDVADLRRRIGAVFQDYMEYDLTAAENIALSDLDAIGDKNRLRAAAGRVQIDEKIAGLPFGYDTLLSRIFFMEENERIAEGVVLSGGEWQRLALARAVLREQCDLMVLDEPSSGLDAEAEYEIHSSLRRFRAGRTNLLISHRLAAVREADRIVVLGDGKIIEQGNHSSLLALDGAYAKLFTLQASGYREQVEEISTASGNVDQVEL